MRAAFAFIFFSIIGFLAIASESDLMAGVNQTPIAVLGSTNAETAVTLEVDRIEDPDRPNLSGCTEAPEDCSLRSAIAIANDNGRATTIRFAEHYIITLRSPLPALIADKTRIIADAGQEVHVNGNNVSGSVLHIASAGSRIEGLRIYGAGAGHHNILINGPAHQVVIARNVIGDDDAPGGFCGQNDQAHAGIYVDAEAPDVEGVRAWIYGNIIECHRGIPGEGIVIMTDRVVVGADEQNQAGEARRNIIRWNHGVAVRLDDHSGNTVRNNLIHDNAAGAIVVSNYNNDLMDNDIRQ